MKSTTSCGNHICRKGFFCERKKCCYFHLPVKCKRVKLCIWEFRYGECSNPDCGFIHKSDDIMYDDRLSIIKNNSITSPKSKPVVIKRRDCPQSLNPVPVMTKRPRSDAAENPVMTKRPRSDDAENPVMTKRPRSDNESEDVYKLVSEFVMSISSRIK